MVRQVKREKETPSEPVESALFTSVLYLPQCFVSDQLNSCHRHSTTGGGRTEGPCCGGEFATIKDDFLKPVYFLRMTSKLYHIWGKACKLFFMFQALLANLWLGISSCPFLPYVRTHSGSPLLPFHARRSKAGHTSTDSSFRMQSFTDLYIVRQAGPPVNSPRGSGKRRKRKE